MNTKSLQHLSQKADGVEVVLFTENGKGRSGFLTNSLLTDFQNEYPPIRIKPNPDRHDRLIVPLLLQRAYIVQSVFIKRPMGMLAIASKDEYN